MLAPLDEGLGAAVPSADWLKADLLAYARDLGLAVSESMTKAQILAVIEAAS